MKRLVMFVLSLLLAMGTVAAAAAAPEDLGPGGLWVHGYVNDFGQFQLDLSVKQGAPKPYTILAVKVYSMPSNTLMAAVVDSSAPESLLKSIGQEQPEAMAAGELGALNPRFGLKQPASKDHSLRIDYVVRRGKGISYVPLARVYTNDMENFEFSAVPMSGGGIKMCGYCGGELCGCVACQTGRVYICCPICTVSCYAAVCQNW